MTDRVLFTCPACLTANRVPQDKAGHHARCGKCGVDLYTRGGGQPLVANESTFPVLVKETPIPLLVDFWAPWCGPCRSLAPSLEKVAQEYAGRLMVVKINTDENRTLAKELMIQSIPTLILYQEGKVRHQIAGALPLQQLRNWINRSMGWL